LEFYVEEKIGNKKASNFTIKAKYNFSNKYLLNKLISINQNAQLMIVVLVDIIYYKFDSDVSSKKHIIMLEDLSIITLNQATSQFLKNKNTLLSNMNTILTQQNLSAALGKNLIPNMTNEQPAQDQNSQDNTANAK
ncbi:31040_t:CDS:2, partial [Gigaspora margarita]